MDDLQTIRKAAEVTGTARQSIATWVKLGLLKGRAATVGHIKATLVSVAAVRELAKQRPPGRPRKSAEAKRGRG